jgi:hypothetical protein
MKPLLICLGCFFSVLCTAQDYLLPNETPVLEFQTLKGKQLVLAVDTNREYLVYRYGTDITIELEFPEVLSTSRDAFKFSRYMRGGGMANEGLELYYLYFTRGNYRYVVVQEYSAATEITNYGIKVIQLSTGETTLSSADPATVNGTLSTLSDIDVVQEGDLLFDGGR